MKAFHRNNIILGQLLILFLLFAVSHSNTEPFNFQRKRDGQIQNNGYNYLKLEVQGNSLNTNYVVSVYSDSSRTNRVQLAQSTNGKALLYHQLSRNDYTIYYTLECDSSTCDGQLNSELSEKIEITEGVTFSFYVSREDPWEFIINASTKKLNVWARGQKSIITHLNGNAEKYENFYIVDNDVYGFTVKGEIGDVINVGCIGLIERDSSKLSFESDTKFILNGPILTGYLKKDVVNEICYGFEKATNEDEDEKLVFGTGVILTKIAYAYIAYNDGTKITDDQKDEIFPSGMVAHIVGSSEINQQKLCVTFPKEIVFAQFEDVEDIVFTYQIVKESSTANGLNLYEPQIRGVLYPRITARDSITAFVPQSIISERINYNLMAMNGFPQMYVVECDNYPLCSFDNLEKSIRPRNINRFCSYSFDNEKKSSPISEKQTLFVVKCKTGSKSEHQTDSKYFDLLCGFGTLMYGDDDKIELVEDMFFNQYALKGQEHNYKIKMAKEIKIQKIFIDVMTYIGDVEISIGNDNLPYSEYFSINKIFISVKVDQYEDDLNEIVLNVKAKNNTYYTVLVNFGRSVEDDSLITNQLQTGMSYLVTIDTTKLDKHSTANKQVKIKNERSYDFVNMLVNFYSINCLIDVTHRFINEKKEADYEQLYMYEYLSVDVRTPEQENYNEEEFEYRISVAENDYSQYKGKLCKVYVSAIEVTDEHEEDTRDILIPDDTPQQVMLTKKINHVSYGYVHFDFENAVLIKFNPKHKAKYKVKIYFENKESKESEATVLTNHLIRLDPQDWETRCKDRNRVCYIQIDITLEEVRNVQNPVLEFSVKSVHSQPVSFIQKNYLRVDYAENNRPQYYFAEIGVNEICSIVVNFLRGSGLSYAKIVRKDISEPEDGANWKKKYRLPDEMDYLMDPFTKEIEIGTYDTDCENGCFLLIKVASDVQGDEIQIDRNYPFTIIVHSYEADSDSYNRPIVRIPTEEYIVGTVIIQHPENRIFKYFITLLDSDAERVVIDFQSDSASLFVSVNSIPTMETAHFTFWSRGRDSVMSFSKEELLEYINEGRNEDEKVTSIENNALFIGIWTNMTDSIFTTPYSLAVRLENGTENDIYRVNSDQKTLCRARKMKNSENYRCLYVIKNDYLHYFQSLVLYANSEDQSAVLNMYAKKISSYDYELGTIKDFPNKSNNEYSSKEEFTDFLFVESLEQDQYLLVSVESDKESTIEFYSCITLYQSGITPNPSTNQLYAAFSAITTTLNFPSEYMVMVNLVGVYGNAKLHWDGDERMYYLKGRDDRLSITSSKSALPHKLIIETSTTDANNDGFIFYLNYNIRIDNANIDALNLYKSVNYVYTDNDLPIVYYAPLTTFKMENNDYYEIFFTFDDLENENKKDLTFYENVPFDVNAYIVKEQNIYEYKLFPYVKIESDIKISGVYDQAIRTGIIRVSKKDIDSSNIPEYERPFLYLSIDKTDDFKTVRKYKKIGVETTVLRSNSDISVSELSNQFGLIKSLEEKKYALRTNRAYKYMNLHFSCVEDNLSIELEKVSNFKKGKTLYGKTFYSLEVKSDTPEIMFLKIKNKKESDQYFMFQYTFSNKAYNDDKYKIADTKIAVKREKNKNNEFDYDINFTPVDNANKLNVTYIIRLINGKRPNTPDVSMKVDDQVVKEFYNPKATNNKLNLKIVNITKTANYVQIIAQIRDKEAVEYLSYQLTEELDPTAVSSKKDNKTALIVVIIVGAILFAVVVVLIIVIIIFNNKNKDLMVKVNQISFAETGDRGDDNDLLAPVN